MKKNNLILQLVAKDFSEKLTFKNKMIHTVYTAFRGREPLFPRAKQPNLVTNLVKTVFSLAKLQVQYLLFVAEPLLDPFSRSNVPSMGSAI